MYGIVHGSWWKIITYTLGRPPRSPHDGNACSGGRPTQARGERALSDLPMPPIIHSRITSHGRSEDEQPWEIDFSCQLGGRGPIRFEVVSPLRLQLPSSLLESAQLPPGPNRWVSLVVIQ